MSDKLGAFDFAAHKARNLERWTTVGWDEIASFAGPNADRFRPAWEKSRARLFEGRGAMALGFCWPALLFSFAWFFYRKMWLFGGLLLVLPVLLAFIFETRAGGSIGMGVAMAMLGKGLYVQHAVGKIGEIREGGGGDAEIARAGGVSVAGGAVGGVILALALAALFYPVLTSGR
ncbi:MAG TPA: hypothetical protein VGB08_10295 [Allosphingosinicella sp.]|jgi:hypothetical protein